VQVVLDVDTAVLDGVIPHMTIGIEARAAGVIAAAESAVNWMLEPVLEAPIGRPALGVRRRRRRREAAS
jgi:hypothetical protein